MTIGGLWSAVNKLPKVQIPQRVFAGHRMAIDANGWLHSLRSVAHSNVARKTDILKVDPDVNKVDSLWLDMAVTGLIGWMAMGITPVLVYDGKKPVAKDETRKEREDKRIAAKEELRVVRATVSDDVLADNSLAVINALKCMNKVHCVPGMSLTKLINALSGMGIPTCMADGDGERAASRMCAEGYVSAVYSVDGDCLAHLAPVLIRGIGTPLYTNGIGEASFKVVFLSTILETYNLTSEGLTEACITAGCDYNTKMRGVGFATAVNLLKKWGTHDNFPKEKYDVSLLNLEECRRLFAPISSNECIVSTTGLNSAVCTDAEKIMGEIGLSHQFQRWNRVISRLTTAGDSLSMDLSLTVEDLARAVVTEDR